MTLAQDRTTVKKFTGFLLGMALFCAFRFLLPAPAGMSGDAWSTLGIIACLLCFWLFDAFPIGMSSAFALALLPLSGVMTLDAASQQFMRPATLFLVTTYAITVSFSRTQLGARLLRRVIRIVGFRTERIILGIMITTCIISSIVSNVPVTAMMVVVSLRLLSAMGAQPGKSRLGRTLMLAIPIAATCGGYITPVGSSNNVLGIGILGDMGGGNITFLRWMTVGLPLAAVLLFIAWAFLVWRFKPESIPEDIARELAEGKDIPDKMTGRERKALTIILVTIGLWVLGSQTGWFDLTLVAVISMLLFFLPGVNVFTWEEFSGAISWDAIFTVGSVMALGSAVISTGLGGWLVDTVFKDIASWPPLPLLIALALGVNFAHLVMPVSPAIITILLPPLILAAQGGGVSAAAVTFVVPMMAGCVQLLPIDAMPILTYSTGYYSIRDMFKSGFWLSTLWSVVLAGWVYVSVVALGM